jgi:hypothetical protein
MGLREGIEGTKLLYSFGPCIIRPLLIMFGECKFTKIEKQSTPYVISQPLKPLCIGFMIATMERKMWLLVTTIIFKLKTPITSRW